MEIRDVIHGTIEVTESESRIIDSPFFQRLRNIKQLGFAENSYPGATHNRFIHSLGAAHTAGIAIGHALRSSPLTPKVLARFTASLRAAALLHDIGHGPLSHTTEFAMPPVEALGLKELACAPGNACPFDGSRRANHEDYTIKIVLQSSLTPALKKALSARGIEPIHVACIINEDIACPDDFFVFRGVDYRPILHQMVSSEIDVDRMDYLSRDSFHAGVSYGKFDFAWLLSNLTHHATRHGGADRCFLALGHKAIYTFDDFLISRYHMFLMVYFHHKSVIYDEMLARYLRSPDCDYEIPSDIESYIRYDDYHLYTHLSRSTNSWARRICERRPFRMRAEFHSGIPTGEAHAREQKAVLERLTANLKSRGVDYIVKTTTSELSKYFNPARQTLAGSRLPIFVSYDNKAEPVKLIPLEECTDLFERYAKKRSITRVYAPE